MKRHLKKQLVQLQCMHNRVNLVGALQQYSCQPVGVCIMNHVILMSFSCQLMVLTLFDVTLNHMVIDSLPTSLLALGFLDLHIHLTHNI